MIHDMAEMFLDFLRLTDHRDGLTSAQRVNARAFADAEIASAVDSIITAARVRP